MVIHSFEDESIQAFIKFIKAAGGDERFMNRGYIISQECRQSTDDAGNKLLRICDMCGQETMFTQYTQTRSSDEEGVAVTICVNCGTDNVKK
jgi:DNA-directed RNA polymerase subunit M/transcription elongation factor TFIIS